MNCPKCNYELKIDDMYDVEHGEEMCIEQFVGHCPICKREFQWDRIFKVDKETNLVECT